MNTSKEIKTWSFSKQQSYVNEISRKHLLTMDLGECVVDFESNILKKLNLLLIQHYPHNQVNLKASIAKHYGLKKDMITLGNGSDEIIEHIPQIFLNPKDYVIVVAPTFFRFIDSSLKKRANVICISLSKKDNFSFTPNTVEKIIKTSKKKNAKLIWLCSPNNPTGIPIQDRHIKRIIKESGALVVLDQVYAELQNKTTQRSIKLVNIFSNLIILKSFSKVFGLAGIRVGFAIANKNLIKLFDEWKLPFNNSGISLEIANRILKEEKLIPRIKLSVKREREALFRKIKTLKNFEFTEKSETNIFIIRHKNKNLFKELLQKNILTADLSRAKGLEKMNFVRITIGNRSENNTLFKALIDID